MIVMLCFVSSYLNTMEWTKEQLEEKIKNQSLQEMITVVSFCIVHKIFIRY